LVGDIKRMWKTTPLDGNPHRQASTEEAVEAAHRVFLTVSFQGKTRPAVIETLGDPGNSNRSIYNFPYYPAPRNALVYRFDTGTHGLQFNLIFDRQGVFRKLESNAID
jgi:hypothetical protein